MSTSSTSEKGHAKNLANLDFLITFIVSLAETYNPSNPNIKLNVLQEMYTNCFSLQKSVNNLTAPYTDAVNNRKILFNPLNKFLTKLLKAFKATEGVNKEKIENFKTIYNKIKGASSTTKPKTADPAATEAQKHSTSQLSYDQRTNNIDLLVALLQNTANYNPNEAEYKVVSIQNLHQNMLTATKAVNTTFVPLNKARDNRNKAFYQDANNLVDTATIAKTYILSILDSSSTQYKAIFKIKFSKIL